MALKIPARIVRQLAVLTGALDSTGQRERKWALVYRKGERRIVKEVRPYTDDHPVALSIRSGSRWFNAWVAQMATPYPKLTKRTGLPGERLLELSHGAKPTPAEVEALAAAWFVTPEGLSQSIADAGGG